MQDPRVFVSHLPALEHAVVNFNVAPCMRLFAWWTLVQMGSTVRFRDHRGLRPADVTVNGPEQVSTLIRSKTLGADDACSCIAVSTWMRAFGRCSATWLENARPALQDPHHRRRLHFHPPSYAILYPSFFQTFLLNSTAAPEFDVAERTVLGGCAAQHIDRYARVAIQVRQHAGSGPTLDLGCTWNRSSGRV